VPATPTLTQADIEAGYDRPEWANFGYLGERQSFLTSTDPEAPARPDRVAAADARLLAEANARGWTAEQLFEWANSKPGRWYGDLWFGNDGTPSDRMIADVLVLPEEASR
jgi:hypothetical protein